MPKTGNADTVSKADSREARAFQRRLAKLITDFLSLKYAGVPAMWMAQHDLLTLQRDVQAAIASAKKDRKSPAKAMRLRELRKARWHARTLGDAWAWVLFGLDERLLFTLADNPQPNPIPRDDPGHRGLVAVAEALANQGKGFPLLHDITDLLRTGDVTFLGRGARPHTVEVKSHVTSSERIGDDVKANLSVVAIWPPDDLGDAAWSVSGHPPSRREPYPALQGERVERQLKRLDKARVLRNAQPGHLIVEGDVRAIMVDLSPPAVTSGWPLYRRLAREARANGYASGVLDEATMVAAMYDKANDGDLPDEYTDRTVNDFTNSGLMFQPGEFHLGNRLWVSGIPLSRTRGPNLYRPYVLAPLQRWAVLDLMRERLGFITMTNMGRVAAAVEAADLTVRLADTSAEWVRAPLIVGCSVTSPAGQTYNVELQNLGSIVVEMIQEARPVGHLVHKVRAMAEAMRQQVPNFPAA